MVLLKPSPIDINEIFELLHRRKKTSIISINTKEDRISFDVMILNYRCDSGFFTFYTRLTSELFKRYLYKKSALKSFVGIYLIGFLITKTNRDKIRLLELF